MAQATRNNTSAPLTPRLVRLLREAALYVLGAIAIYLLVSLWTYQPSDPSWSYRGPSQTVQNAGGWVGAWVADVMLSLFGYVAYLLPIMVALLGWRIFEHRKDEIPLSRKHRIIVGTGFVLALIGACGLASLHYAKSGQPFASGGWLGNTAGAGLVSAFSFTGATLFLLALFLSGATLTTGLSWLKLMDRLGHLGIDGVQRAREFISTQMDRFIGMRAKRQRREVVEEDKKVLEKHPAPRIEPVVPRVKESKRAQQERQAPLFVTPGSKELPPLSLLDPAEKQKAPQFSKQSLESMARLLEKSCSILTSRRGWWRCIPARSLHCSRWSPPRA